MFLVRLIWKLIKAVIWIAVIIILVPIAGLAYGYLTTAAIDTSPLPGIAEGAPPPALAARIRAEIPNYQRPEESTYLTYPEWAIVYAAREYAGFVDDRSESGFPYWAYIGRFWQDYAMVIRASRDYPFNVANHQMLAVIGTSHTIEHGLQSIYENTVGRITEAVAGRKTAADRYIAGVAADYAAFLDQTPWYQYPYWNKRTGLLDVRPMPDDAASRMEERKTAFGSAWAVKQAYADLIKAGLAATSDAALLDIHVWAKGPVGEAIRGEPDTLLERDFGADGAVFVTRRYQVFTDMIPRLLQRNISFVEIGGNDEILLTALSPASIQAPEGSRVLFSYALPADPSVTRTGLTVAVRRLHTVIPAMTAAGAKLEHLYDY
jgi:hypothetical protein